MDFVLDFICDLCGKNFLMQVYKKPEERQKITIVRIRKAYDTHIKTPLCVANRP